MKLSTILFLTVTVFGKSSSLAQEIYFDWAISASGAASEAGMDIVSLSDGSVVVVGQFEGSVDFDPGPGSFVLHAINFMDGFIARYNYEGKLIWAGAISNTSTGFVPYEWANSITTDSAQNLYCTGMFMAPTDFDPGPNEVEISPLGERDAFILKLDSAGNFIWVKNIGGNAMSKVNGSDIKIGQSGSIYLAGHFNQNCDFDAGPGTTIMNSTGFSPYVAKYDANGNFLWVKVFLDMAAGLENLCYDIELDADENIITGGQLETTVDFDPGSGTYLLSAPSFPGYPDVWVCKLSSDGDFIWAADFGSEEMDYFNDLCLDQNGNIYVTGGFRGTGDYDPGPDVLNITPVDWVDAFIFKLSAEGKLIWINTFGDFDLDMGSSIVYDDSGFLFVSGTFSGTVDFDPGPGTNFLDPTAGSGFLQKTDSAGTALWTYNQPPGNMFLKPNGNLYFTGSFYEAIDLDIDSPVFELSPVSESDILIVKYKQDTSLYEGPPIHTDTLKTYNEFRIYPVPATKTMWVEIPDSLDNIILELFDITGQCLLHQTCNSGLNQIDMSIFSSGPIVIRITSDQIILERILIKIND
jgi:hypothetical protein